MFLGLGHVILCARCFLIRALADGCTRAPGTAIPHAPAAPFCAVGKLNGAKKNRAEPRGVIFSFLVTTSKDGIGIRQLS